MSRTSVIGLAFLMSLVFSTAIQAASCEPGDVAATACSAHVAEKSKAMNIFDAKVTNLREFKQSCSTNVYEDQIKNGVKAGIEIGQIPLSAEDKNNETFDYSVRFKCRAKILALTPNTSVNTKNAVNSNSRISSPGSETLGSKTLSAGEIMKIESDAGFSGGYCTDIRSTLDSAVIPYRQRGYPIQMSKDLFDNLLRKDINAWRYAMKTVDEVYRRPEYVEKIISLGLWSQSCVKIVRGY